MPAAREAKKGIDQITEFMANVKKNSQKDPEIHDFVVALDTLFAKCS